MNHLDNNEDNNSAFYNSTIQKNILAVIYEMNPNKEETREETCKQMNSIKTENIYVSFHNNNIGTYILF